LANANEVFVPSIALGELYYGAHKSSHVEANITRIDEFAASNSILTCDTETSQQYGKIKNSLRVKGRPIPGKGNVPSMPPVKKHENIRYCNST
jgi:tRNA(fMet)-specific endonuclease VapC